MSQVKCKCDQIFSEVEFTRHFPSCKSFMENFKNFDNQFNSILKPYAHEKENLFIIRILLKQYTLVVEKKIKQR